MQQTLENLSAFSITLLRSFIVPLPKISLLFPFKFEGQISESGAVFVIFIIIIIIIGH